MIPRRRCSPGAGRLPGALLFLWAVLGSCSYDRPTRFWFGSGGPEVLRALSKEASQGILPLAKPGSLEYRFSSPQAVPRDCSLEVSYRWKEKAGAAGQAVLEAEQVSLGAVSWELPGDFAFQDDSPLPMENSPASTEDSFLIKYALPVPPGDLEGINLRWEPDSGGTSPTTANSAGKEAALIIQGFRLVPRRFGFSLGESDGLSINLSPFVYYRDRVFHIDPPASYRCSPEELWVWPRAPGALAVETGGGPGDSGYFRIEDTAPKERLTVNNAFLASAPFPLRISGAELSGAELSLPETSPASVSLKPIPADPGLILSWPQEAWRDQRYELFSWDSFPSILIFDFADYAVQDRFLKRLAFYTEKAGFRGRLAPDSEIAHLHGWNAHDYRAETLAAFFNLARETAFPLLAEERELEALLLDSGLIRRDSNGALVPGEGAIISVTRESPGYLRSLFMAHEGFHGLYFIDREFRDFCRTRWESFTGPPREFILSYFGYQSYDTRDTDLVINEFMAHILQQSVSQAGPYFGKTLAARIEASPWRRAVLPRKDEASGSWPTLAAAFRAEAQAFSGYVNQRWGLSAGRVRKVTVER